MGQMNLRRRQFLRGCAALGILLSGAAGSPRAAGAGGRGNLRPRPLVPAPGLPDVLVPEGCEARVVAQAGHEPVPGCGYDWHAYPDGGTVFPQPDGGWIYVSNSEMPCVSTKKTVMRKEGGVGALRFDASGELADAYPILSGTARNCAGGPTPWGTWLSCEEFRNGRVWECDPTGRNAARVLPGLGVFTHEAAAVDDRRGQVYLSEDEYHGYLYRFRPDRYPDLSAGVLEAAVLTEGGEAGRWHLDWVIVPDPQGGVENPCREQVQATRFLGGEGLWLHEDILYLATKHDGRIWAFDLAQQSAALVYDRAAAPSLYVKRIDNLYVTPDRTVLVAEERGDMRLVAIGKDGTMFPVVQLLNQEKSEIAGQAFSPDGTRLYFSSQRGPGWGVSGMPLSPPILKQYRTCLTVPGNSGVTYEVRGPFFA